MKAIVNGKLVFPEVITEGSILIVGDRIIDVGHCQIPEGAEIIDAHGLYVGPGLIDEHCHGYKQYGQAIDIINDVRGMAEGHLKHGTTAIIPTIGYSLTKDVFMNTIKSVNHEISRPGSSVIGMHFEGPFINPAHGANSELAWKYTEECFSEILEQAGKNLIHCTYAPEIPEARQLEMQLQQRGIVADIGHTKTDPENLERAVEAGARIVTHLYDAMGNYKGVKEAAAMTGDPQDCVSDLVLGKEGLYYELICDSWGMHVTSSSMKLALRCAGEDHIILISDCTGRSNTLDPEDYTEDDPRSAKDLNFNIRGQLSGSRLTVADGVRNFMQKTGVDLRIAWRCASANPAKALGVDDFHGTIHSGKYANLLLADEKMNIERVLFKGKVLEEVRNSCL